jgi:hypothetical protein
MAEIILLGKGGVEKGRVDSEVLLAKIREQGTTKTAEEYGVKNNSIKQGFIRAGLEADYRTALTQFQARKLAMVNQRASEASAAAPTEAKEEAKPPPAAPPPPPEEKKPAPIIIEKKREGEEGTLTAEVKKPRPRPVRKEKAVATEEEEKPKAKGMPSWVWYVIGGAGLLIVGLMLFRWWRNRGGGWRVPASPTTSQPCAPCGQSPSPETPPPPPPPPAQPSEEEIVEKWRKAFGLE